ncbi:bifunctional riboflavin kinase/FAD synthetase [Bacillus salitolerans]|uniref:Riboflavin biosynthesis protein n=1 Tax=Bacillus salitolerans TaxID=1437434 RepID=A0ABW4LL70_9BACI
METFFLNHPHHIKRELTKPKAMAFGYFDGVHLGHQQVINEARKMAHRKGYQSAVMTFHPHPSIVLGKNNPIRHSLTPLNDKIEIIESLGVDELYVVEFSEAFSMLLPQEFVDSYIIGLHVKHAVAGFDFTYGKMGKGTMETLPFHSRHEFEQTVVGKIELAHKKVSSTYIRSLLQEGDVSKVQMLLGRNYKIKGTIIHGEKRGRTIGFPTANIKMEEQYLLPKLGVYVVKLKVRDTWYEGVCNIGLKPTFHDDLKEVSIEVHLLEFSDTIYDQKVELEFIARIRDEQKFGNIQELIDRIHRDVSEAKNFFNSLIIPTLKD